MHKKLDHDSLVLFLYFVLLQEFVDDLKVCEVVNGGRKCVCSVMLIKLIIDSLRLLASCKVLTSNAHDRL
jgi:hypothetical protein